MDVALSVRIGAKIPNFQQLSRRLQSTVQDLEVTHRPSIRPRE
jgi:hypothetical protein